MGKKTIFKGDLKKVLLIEKSIFKEIWTKTDFYKLISKQRDSARNVHISGQMGEREFFKTEC